MDENIDRLELSIGRAYSATDAADLLDMDIRTFNRRVSEGMLEPLWSLGSRRFSGFDIARLLHWPLSDDAKDYVPVKMAKGSHLGSLGDSG